MPGKIDWGTKRTPTIDWSKKELPPKKFTYKATPHPIFSTEYSPKEAVRYVDIGNEHWKMIQEELARISQIPGVAVGEPGYQSAAMNLTRVQQVRFGERRATRDGGTHRGYCMIEPEVLLPALQQLHAVGEKRLSVGKHLEYKLVQPEGINFDDTRALKRHCDALYLSTPSNQLITLYADNPREIQEIFRELTERDWVESIEKPTQKIRLLQPSMKPLHGTARFIANSQNNEPLRTLEFNAGAGFAEHQTR
jgi:hypothetical protein